MAITCVPVLVLPSYWLQATGTAIPRMLTSRGT